MPARALPSGDATDVDEAGAPTLYAPGQLEHLNRLMAARECLIILRDLRGNEAGAGDATKAETDAILEQIQNGAVILTYPFLHPDGRPYFLTLTPGSPLFAAHPLSARARIKSYYPERTFTRESTNRWGPG